MSISVYRYEVARAYDRALNQFNNRVAPASEIMTGFVGGADMAQMLAISDSSVGSEEYQNLVNYCSELNEKLHYILYK